MQLGASHRCRAKLASKWIIFVNRIRRHTHTTLCNITSDISCTQHPISSYPHTQNYSLTNTRTLSYRCCSKQHTVFVNFASDIQQCSTCMIGVEGCKLMRPELTIPAPCLYVNGRLVLRRPRNSIANLVKSAVSPLRTQWRFFRIFHRKSDKLLTRRFSCKFLCRSVFLQ